MFYNKLNKGAFYSLVIINSILLLFGFFSGARRGDFVSSAMNTLPWLIVGIFTVFAFIKPFVGGCCVTIAGIMSVIMFDFYVKGHMIGLFIVAMPLIIVGSLLMYSYFLSRKQKSFIAAHAS